MSSQAKDSGVASKDRSAASLEVTPTPHFALDVTPAPTPPPVASLEAERTHTLGAPTFADRPSHDFGALASLVTEAFKDFSFGDGDWYIDLSAPHVAATTSATGEPGPALQHLRLRPRRPRVGTSTIVLGTVNPVDNRAELRDYDHVAFAHEVRHRQPFQIKPSEWEQLLRKAEAVLNAADIQSLRTPPRRELLDQRRSLKRISRGALALLVVVLLLAAVVAWRVVAALVT